MDFENGGLNKINNFNKTNIFINAIFRMIDKQIVKIESLKENTESIHNILKLIEILSNTPTSDE